MYLVCQAYSVCRDERESWEARSLRRELRSPHLPAGVTRKGHRGSPDYPCRRAAAEQRCQPPFAPEPREGDLLYLPGAAPDGILPELPQRWSEYPLALPVTRRRRGQSDEASVAGSCAVRAQAEGAASERA